MENTYKPGRLRSIAYYLPKALKFYDLKNEPLTRIAFVFSLFSIFLLLQGNAKAVLSNTLNAGAAAQAQGDFFSTFILPLLLYIVNALYLLAVIREFKGREYTLAYCFKKVQKRAFQIIFASLGYILPLNIGVVAAVIIHPLLTLVALPLAAMFAVIYVFNTCYIVDLGEGIMSSYAASNRITKGSRWRLFGIFLVFFLVIIILMVPFILLSTVAFLMNNVSIYIFVLSFVLAACSLMQQKLIAMLYVDLEYGTIENKQDEKN